MSFWIIVGSSVIFGIICLAFLFGILNSPDIRLDISRRRMWLSAFAGLVAIVAIVLLWYHWSSILSVFPPIRLSQSIVWLVTVTAATLIALIVTIWTWPSLRKPIGGTAAVLFGIAVTLGGLAWLGVWLNKPSASQPYASTATVPTSTSTIAAVSDLEFGVGPIEVLRLPNCPNPVFQRIVTVWKGQISGMVSLPNDNLHQYDYGFIPVEAPIEAYSGSTPSQPIIVWPGLKSRTNLGNGLNPGGVYRFRIRDQDQIDVVHVKYMWTLK